jgi:hypothetical protein
MERTELVERLILAMGERLPGMSPADLAARLDGWELHEAAGAVVMRRGAEMHVAALPEARGRWASSTQARKLIRETFDRFGVVTTAVMKDHQPGHTFVRRLGFEPVGDSGAAIRYELRTLRHA